RSLMDFPQNYSFAVKGFSRGDEGRPYNVNNFNSYENWGTELLEIALIPSAHLERSPYYQRMMNLYCYSEPYNYWGTMEPWGDLGYGVKPRDQSAPLYCNYYLMSEIAAFTGNGAALRQAQRQDSNPTRTREFEWINAFYNPNPPSQVDWP